ELERDKTALLDHYAGMVPNGLDELSPEERHRVFKILGLKVTVQPSGVLEVSGTFGERLELSGHQPTSASGARCSARSKPTPGCGGKWKRAPPCRGTRSSSTWTGQARSGTQRPVI